MIMFRPSVDAAVTIEDQSVAAVPVPILFGEAQAAIASGAWATACLLLQEVVRLEPGFRQNGRSARELLEEVQLGRDGEELSVVGLDQLPLPFVNHPVMPIAEQDEVGQVAGTASDPVDEVMA